MTFIKALVTEALRLYQVKAYHTDLAVTSLCMAVNKIHDPQIGLNIEPKVVDEIHSLRYS